MSFFRGSLAAAASDHFPLVVKIRSDEPTRRNDRGKPATPAPAAVS